MAAKKKMKAQVTARPISAKELKFWLEGILEFQVDGWVPNKEQWKSIQDKIFNLQETVEVLHQQVAPNSRREIPVGGTSSTLMENAFHPQGGAAGLPAGNFPQEPLPSVLSNGPGIANIPMPVHNENGFYTMPDNVGIGETYVAPSGGAVHRLKDGFA